MPVARRRPAARGRVPVPGGLLPRGRLTGARPTDGRLIGDRVTGDPPTGDRLARLVLTAAVTTAVTTAVAAGCAAPGAIDDAPRTPPSAPAASPTDSPTDSPGDAVPPTAPEPAPSPPGAGADVDAEDVRARGVAVVVGGTTVLHVLPLAPATAVHAVPDGEEVVLTVDPGDPAAAVDALVAVPDGARLEPQEDGSFVVLGGDGDFLAGAGVPARAGGGTPPRVVPATDGVLRVEGTGPVTARVGTAALLGTDWGEREGGRSLAVEPAPWARSAGLAGEVAVWTELVAAVPEADTPVMHDQLVCHAVGAPDKPTWNLEPWRPDIGLLRIMLAGCNPT